MTIKVKMDKCTDFQDVNCISSVTLTYQNSIVKMEREKLFINHVDYSETIRSTPYSFNGIYVKEVTNKFRVVKAFGLKILYDKRRTLYIDLKPFYANKVSPDDGMQIANVLFKHTTLVLLYVNKKFSSRQIDNFLKKCNKKNKEKVIIKHTKHIQIKSIIKYYADSMKNFMKTTS